MKEIRVLKIFPRLRFRNTNILAYTQNQEMASTFKGDEGVTFHDIWVQAKHLLSEGVHLGRKGMMQYFHELKWLIIKGIKKFQ